jgi:hypothetical protein
MTESIRYRYLQPKRGSSYQQLAVNGRIRAEILYRMTVGTEPLSPEEVAAEYGLPVEAVREAIHYCEHNRELLDAERASEQASIEANGFDRWPHAPKIPSDPRHLVSCAVHGLALLTRDHGDFLDLHNLVRATQGRHRGILVVRADNDPSRDMKDRDIVRALMNLEGAQIAIENEFHILNHWR